MNLNIYKLIFINLNIYKLFNFLFFTSKFYYENHFKFILFYFIVCSFNILKSLSVHLIFWKVCLFHRVCSCFETPTTATWFLWHRWSCNVWSYSAERLTDNKGFSPAISFSILRYSTKLDVEGSGGLLLWLVFPAQSWPSLFLKLITAKPMSHFS